MVWTSFEVLGLLFFLADSRCSLKIETKISLKVMLDQNGEWGWEAIILSEKFNYDDIIIIGRFSIFR